ncbi:MAG: methylmalonyl-CoA mutase family protein, partial [Hyphomonadaceae bacterium]|nr:methylmalonyl-CoA mutase family protein [Hyphomonadaceae bacterium]
IVALATVALDAPADPLGAARALADAVPEADRATAKLAFNLDPLAARMNGQTGCSLEAAAGFAAQTQSLFPMATCLRADARPVHEGGGSEAQELALLIASGIAHLRAGEALGLSAAAVNSTLLFTLAAGPDVVVEIAKQRAARRLWARVMDACGVAAPMRLQAVTSGRMQTKRDPWTNILRATCACFGAAAGGADVITVLPYSSALGLPDENARRIARNTQLILQEESHLGRVTDPAGGAWAMEALAEDLAQAAWPLVQEIERAGGLPAALDQGLVQAWVAQTRAARVRDIAKRKTQLIGINIFANLDEVLPATPAIAATSTPATPLPGAIPPMRLAQDFEALRDRADSLSPKIFLATLGALAKFSARAGFARNAFEAGGIKALGTDVAHADQAALITAFKASGAQLVCLCGDDATYEAQAAEAAAALKAAGATQIWLAGKFQAPAIDRNLFAGADILAELTHAITLLEEPA